MIDLAKYVGSRTGRIPCGEGMRATRDLADGDAMQADVDAAWDALVTAMENLRLKADKEALQDLWTAWALWI